MFLHPVGMVYEISPERRGEVSRKWEGKCPGQGEELVQRLRGKSQKTPLASPTQKSRESLRGQEEGSLPGAVEPERQENWIKLRER